MTVLKVNKYIKGLIELLKIPSVPAQPKHKKDVKRTAKRLRINIIIV